MSLIESHQFNLLPWLKMIMVKSVLTHGWALPTAPRSTLSSEHGHLSLQHLHPGDELLDGCCCHWLTTAGRFGDVDAVSECYLKDNKGSREKRKLAPIELVGRVCVCACVCVGWLGVITAEGQWRCGNIGESFAKFSQPHESLRIRIINIPVAGLSLMLTMAYLAFSIKCLLSVFCWATWVNRTLHRRSGSQLCTRAFKLGGNEMKS